MWCCSACAHHRKLVLQAHVAPHPSLYWGHPRCKNLWHFSLSPTHCFNPFYCAGSVRAIVIAIVTSLVRFTGSYTKDEPFIAQTDTARVHAGEVAQILLARASSGLYWRTTLVCPDLMSLKLQKVQRCWWSRTNSTGQGIQWPLLKDNIGLSWLDEPETAKCSAEKLSATRIPDSAQNGLSEHGYLTYEWALSEYSGHWDRTQHSESAGQLLISHWWLNTLSCYHTRSELAKSTFNFKTLDISFTDWL